mgnify:CR=1 FL=1
MEKQEIADILTQCKDALCGVKVRVDDMPTSGIEIVKVINSMEEIIADLQKQTETKKGGSENGSADHPGGWNNV